MKHRRLVCILRAAFVCALLCTIACGDEISSPSDVEMPPKHPTTSIPNAPTDAEASPSLDFVGETVCGECHASQAEKWSASHHDLAMQVADDTSVLGDFDDTRFDHKGSRARFYRRGERFYVETEGPEGTQQEYEISHTFGVEPLQQYLIAFPGGRLQALSIAWDSRPESKGGQRWIHLYPDEVVPHDDVLHWTKPAQNWNRMCADCHSTGVRKGYSLEASSYDTHWLELDVSCEACHGPGSQHVEWARSRSLAATPEAKNPASGLVVDLSGSAPGTWSFVAGEPIAQRVGPLPSNAQIDTCARCHARRGAIRDPYEWGLPLLDTHRPALLEEGLYYPDGQMDGEVYVWGSFVQSRMHAAGVTCTDCHDPHSLRIEAPDATCARCHDNEHFATPSHHHHGADSTGASCVSCHMPERTYMVVDARRDHSFRIPRPDLSVALGTPNTCTSCHADQSAQWAASAAQGWWGDSLEERKHFALGIDAGRQRLPGAGALLRDVVDDAGTPAIARATAIALLPAVSQEFAAEAIEKATRDDNALVRMAAMSAGESIEPGRRARVLLPGLDDPILAVRISAARALASLPPQMLRATQRARLAAVLAEYRSALLVNADEPGTHLNLGVLHSIFGEVDEARTAYETALELAPWFVPASVNLADLHSRSGSNAEAERTLRSALHAVPEQPDLQHALGLLLVRAKRLPEALLVLEAAARASNESRYAYVYGIALHSVGRSEDALAVLEAAQVAHPGDRDLLAALATLSRDAGNAQAALRWARALLRLDPEDPGAQQLVAELERRSSE